MCRCSSRCGGTADWLTCTALTVGPNPSGIAAVAIPMLYFDSTGSGITIDAGDPTKIIVERDGRYQLGFSGYPIEDTNNTSLVFTGYAGYVATLVPGGSGVLSFTHTRQEQLLSNGLFIGAATWVMNLAAGSFVQVNVAVATDDGDTWGGGAGLNSSFQVLRVG